MTRRSIITWALASLLLSLPAQAQWAYTTNGASITITGYTGPGGAVTIPDMFNGLPVAGIGATAFGNNSSLTSVIVSSNVTSIGNYAFEFCGSLTNLQIPASVTSFGQFAFYGVGGGPWTNLMVTIYACGTNTVFAPNRLGQDSVSELINVTLGNGITGIGNYAFEFCGSLTNLWIPTSVTSFGQFAFYGVGGGPWTNLVVTIYASGTNTVFAPNRLGQDSVSELINVTLANGITGIGNYAFEFCGSLTNLLIPASVTSFGQFAFDGVGSGPWSNLTVTIYASGTNTVFAPSRTSSDGVTEWFNVTLANGITGVGNQAFEDCASLTNLLIPATVTSFEQHAFDSCTSLTTVTVPNSVTNIGDYAFSSCISLTNVYFLGNAPGIGSDVFDSDNHATIYYLPSTTNWGATFGGRPTVLWLPRIQNLGPQANQFGFDISWASGQVVVVEACTDLAFNVWAPLGTNTLTGGLSHFGDSQWTNYPARFYRLRAP